jgi:MFS superfamily sulfate permease-like transporter
MLRTLVVIGAAIAVVLVALEVVRTFIWLAMIALIVGAVCLALGAFRLGHRSGRSRGRL